MEDLASFYEMSAEGDAIVGYPNTMFFQILIFSDFGCGTFKVLATLAQFSSALPSSSHLKSGRKLCGP
jgi:hypothetical protein